MNARQTMFATLLLIATACAGAQVLPAEVNIVPRPAKIKMLHGAFTLTGATRIVAADQEARRIAGLFNDFLLEQYGLRLEVTSTRPHSANYLRFDRAGAGGMKPEGYHLVIGADSVRVIGAGPGLFYGMQTLTQLLPVRLGASIELHRRY